MLSNFVWRNVDSRTYALRLAHIGSPGVAVIPGMSDIEIMRDRTVKRTEPYIYGTRLADNVEYEATAMNRNGQQYSSFESEAIQEWLSDGGGSEPGWFNVLTPDTGNTSYLAFLRNIRAIKIGDMVMGFRFIVHVVGGHSYTDLVETRYELTTDAAYINFTNLSNVREYLRPEITVELLGNTTFFAMQNLTDRPTNRIFELHDLQQGDTIFIDCDRKILRAQSGDDVFNKSNLVWPRFHIGTNRLYLDGRARVTFKNRWKKLVHAY